ncbi:MAG: hypothetical protein LBV74_02435 [Tannerella sp.]|jgi:hypothetical protein|nr:hypothetical protein [Tannerella sp.]
MTKSFIGIKRLWYAPSIASIASAASGLTSAEVLALIANASTKEIKNIHQDTWGYEESDPTVTEYINQLTGKPYYRDAEQQGVPTISFTLGEYEYEDKAALQGGKATAGSWERSDSPEIIEKCIIAEAKTGEVIVFPRASVLGKGNYVEKNIGLGVTAVPVDTGVSGLASEKWFRGVVIP